MEETLRLMKMSPLKWNHSRKSAKSKPVEMEVKKKTRKPTQKKEKEMGEKVGEEVKEVVAHRPLPRHR